MRVIYVISEVNYVKDNYLYLLENICNPRRLPSGIEIVAAVLIKVPKLYLARNILGLIALGAPRVAIALLRNSVKALLNDPRQKIFRERKIPFLYSENINAPKTIDFIASFQPDLIVNMRTRNIYKKGVLSIPRIGCINIHHGLLPDNRGTMCDLWAWHRGDQVGFSIHWMNEKIDDGKIIAREKIDTKNFKNYLDIPFYSSVVESETMMKILKEIREKGKENWIPNKSEHPVYFRNPTPSQILEIRRSGKKL